MYIVKKKTIEEKKEEKMFFTAYLYYLHYMKLDSPLTSTITPIQRYFLEQIHNLSLDL